MNAAETIQGILRIQDRWEVKTYFLALFFAFCMYPVTVGDPNTYTLSVNYAFLLCPCAALLCTGKLRRPQEVFLFAMTFYVLVFAAATIYQFDLLSDFIRRLTSFILFIGIFSFMFVKIDDRMIRAFKVAVILASCYFSLKSVIVFFISGGSSLGYDAKDVVGTQRYGFIYLMAFWIVYLSTPKTLIAKVTKGSLIFIALIGLVLTFSRASIVALMGSFLIFTFWSLRGVSPGRLVKGAILTAIGATIAYFLLSVYFPIILEFFGDRLFGFFSHANTVEDHLANSETSEGARIQVWATILQYIFSNPLTGAGYLGVWIVRETAGLASAHNQYFDVLFRTGILGLIIYLILLFQTAKHLWTKDQSLFWGLIGTIVYGFFHETFKESQGAFVLAFLLGMMSQGHLTFPDLPGLRALLARKPPTLTP